MSDPVQTANAQAQALLPPPPIQEISGPWPFAGLAASLAPKRDLSELVRNWTVAHQRLVEHNLRMEQQVVDQQLRNTRSFAELQQTLMNNLTAKQATLDAIQSGLAAILSQGDLYKSMQLQQDSRDVATSILAESQQVLQKETALAQLQDNFGAYIAGRFQNLTKDPHLSEIMRLAKTAETQPRSWDPQARLATEGLVNATTPLPFFGLTDQQIANTLLSATQEVFGEHYRPAISRLAQGDASWADGLSSDEIRVLQHGWKAAIASTSSMTALPDILKDKEVAAAINELNSATFGTENGALTRLAARLRALTTPNEAKAEAAPATALWAAWLTKVGGPLLTAVTPGDVQHRLATATHLAAIKAIRAGENVLQAETLAKHRLGELVIPVVAEAVISGDIKPFIPYLQSLGLDDLDMDELFRTGAGSLHDRLLQAVREQRIPDADASVRAWQEAQLALFPSAPEMAQTVAPLRRQQYVQNAARDYLDAMREAPPDEQTQFARALGGQDPAHLETLYQTMDPDVVDEMQRHYRTGASLGAGDLQQMLAPRPSGPATSQPTETQGEPQGATQEGAPAPVASLVPTTGEAPAAPPTAPAFPSISLEATRERLNQVLAAQDWAFAQGNTKSATGASTASSAAAPVDIGMPDSPVRRLITPESLMQEQRSLQATFNLLMPTVPTREALPAPQAAQAPAQRLPAVTPPPPLTYQPSPYLANPMRYWSEPSSEHRSPIKP